MVSHPVPVDDDPMVEQVNRSTAVEADWLRAQIRVFERRLALVESSARAEHLAPAEASAPPPPPPVRSVAPPPPRDAGATEESEPPAPNRTGFSPPAVESLLKWAGLILMFLSAVFLVSTAIQRGWIGPELQLLGAAAIGVSLIGGGLVIGHRRAGWDVPLVSVGVAVLSATSTAGWEWLELGAVIPWIVASFLVLGSSIELTRRLGGPGPAATGLVTTATSVGVLATSVPMAAVLLALVVLIGEAAGVWRRLDSLHLVTVATGLVSFAAVAGAAAVTDHHGSVAVVGSGALVTTAFWLMPVARVIRGSLPSPLGIDWRPTVDRLTLSLPVLFTTAWALADGLSEQQAGTRLLMVGGVALASGALTAGTERFPASVWVSQLMGGAAALAVGSTLVFEGPALIIGMATQAALLLVFVHVVGDRWATAQAGVMAGIAGLLTLSGMVNAVESDAPAVDDLAHLAVVAMVAGWAWWTERRARDDRRGDRVRAGVLLAALAFGGSVLWPVSALVHLPQGQALISAAWAAIGFATLLVAFARSSVGPARISLVTLAVVVVKLLTVDLAAVDTFWRVGLFFVLGGTFLFASFRVGTALQAEDQDSGLAFQK